MIASLVILPREAWGLWLGEEEACPERLASLLKACPEGFVRLYPVGPAIGDVKNDEPSLLDPIEADLPVASLI